VGCSAANATSSCPSNACVYACNSGWVDVDHLASDGCECPDDGGGKACSSYTDLGTIASGGSAPTQIGHLPLAFEEKWYRVNFSSPPSSSPVHYANIIITSDDGSIRFDVLRGPCTGTSALNCGDGGVSTSRYSWDQQQVGDASGIVCGSSTKACQTTCNCSRPAYDQVPAVGVVFIRVFRPGGAATCVKYSLTVND
jgi:hypothetical protein